MSRSGDQSPAGSMRFRPQVPSMALGSQLEAHSVLGERARALVPLADEWADWADIEGRIADPVVARLHDDGLYAMWVPKALGGAESTRAVARGTRKCFVRRCLGRLGAHGVVPFDRYRRRVISTKRPPSTWSDGKRPVIAGQGTRPGTATPTEGGFLLSGSWSFASGIKHGTHIHTLGIIESTGEPRIFVVPVEKATLIDNWDVIGLRGTGSIDYTIDNVFVPEGYTHFATIAHSERAEGLTTSASLGFAVLCHSGWALGVGRRLLDELANIDEGEGGERARSPNSVSFHEGFAGRRGRSERRAALSTRPGATCSKRSTRASSRRFGNTR